MSDDLLSNLERQLREAVARARKAQEMADELALKLPQRWDWNEEDNTWTIHGQDCWIWMQARPNYCDRGSWLAHIELKAVPANQLNPVHLDGADGWPRYYFDLRRAKAECEAWLKKRRQWVEEP